MLTHTPQKQSDEIINLMKQDIEGKILTGFEPYQKNNEIYFNHHWIFNMGIKI